MQKKKILYLDILRIIASIAVISIHVVALYWDKYPVDSFEWCAFNFYDSISRWAVPVFCMISGVLFLDPTRKVSIKNLITKNSFRMITAFTGWSLLYAIYTYDIAEIGIKGFILKVIGGHYHMWYIFLIVGFYLTVPLFRRISSQKALTEYFILLSILATFIVPFIGDLPGLNVVNTITSKSFLLITAGYTPYFFIGYYINKFGLPKIIEKIIIILGPISFIATIFGTLYVSVKADKFVNLFYHPFSLTVLFEALFIFVAVKEVCKEKEPKKAPQKIIDTLSKDSFGVYMVHIFVLLFLQKFGFDAVTFNPFIAIPLNIITAYFISELISFILHKIPVVNKYMV